MTDIKTSKASIDVTDGASIQAHVALPASGGGTVATVVLGEIWGVNANMKKICSRLAEAGIVAVAPDLYRDASPPVETDPPDRVLRSFAEYPDPRGISDCRAAVRWTKRTCPGVERVYALGFCMGGRFAHYLGAFSESVSGVVNFYGRLRFPKQDIKPFVPLDLCELIDVPYLGLFAEHDDLIAREDVAELEARLSARGTPHFVRTYQGAHHAFFNESRPSYHPSVARESWERTLAFLRTESVR